MKQVLVLLLVLALGAGLMAFLWITPVSAVESGGTSSAAPADTSADELAELRRSIEQLAARVEQLELEPPSTLAPAQRVSADAVTPAELAEIRDMVAALRDPQAATGVPFEDLVLGVIENRELLEERQRTEARAEAAAERIEKRVAELAEELGLSSFQSGEMLGILTTEQTERDLFFTGLRESGSFDRSAIRDGMETLRKTTLEAVAKVLSPDQYDRYVTSSESQFGFGGAGGRGGRDGGGPGR